MSISHAGHVTVNERSDELDLEVDLPPVLAVLARFIFLGHFLGRHVDEEAKGFAADIARKTASTSSSASNTDLGIVSAIA